MAPMSFCLASLVASSLYFLVGAAPLQQRQTGTSGKRGLPYNTATLANLFESYSEITWGYNWYYESQGLAEDLEYIPMLYSDPTGNPQYASEWQGNATAAIASGSQHLLAFNEPDINNLTPAQAAQSYMNYMQPFASDTVKLGAPAVTNGGAPDGLAWLEEFLGNCTSCTIDFVPFHWYCYYDDISYFTSYVQQAYAAAGNRPLWITEFQGVNEYCASTATDEQQAEFMQTVLPWLDSLSYVQRYAYFGVFESTTSDTYLLNDAGDGFSQSGQVYATLSSVNSTTPTALTD